ncbi:MAG: hypothetical protein H6Q89_2671 [Myxococcaceae bacterium]|nr:hypothetical protein [Myxococcaceae bacterium]
MLSWVAALVLSACDLDAATHAQLATLTSPAQRSTYRFELSVLDGRLQVRLVTDNGLVRSREVAATGACEDDAMVAAVILSAWMAQSEPARSPRALTKPAPRPAPVRPAPSPVQAPEPAEQTPSAPAVTSVDPEPAPSASPPEEDPGRPLPREPAGKARWMWSASLEGGAVIGGGGAPALTLRAEGGMRLGVVVDLTVAMEREQALGAGSVLWSREFGGVGIRVRWLPEKRWLIDASLSLAAGVVFARGVGFTAVSGSGQIDGGACAGVVVGGYELGPFGVFLSARGCGWPWAPRIAVEGVEEQLQLPVFEGVMGIGVMWGGRGG